MKNTPYGMKNTPYGMIEFAIRGVMLFLQKIYFSAFFMASSHRAANWVMPFLLGCRPLTVS